MILHDVPEIQADDIDYRLLDKLGAPVCIRSYFNVDRWDIDRFINQNREIEIPVEYSLQRIFHPRPQLNNGRYYRNEMTLDTAAQLIFNNKKVRTNYYISSLPIGPYFPVLSDFVPEHKRLTKRKLKVAAFFMGADGTGTYFHYDTTDNLIGILSGEKLVYLRPPSAIREMKPYSIKHSCCKFTSIRPDENGNFPKLSENAIFQSCRVRPGDLLYIPSCWWHHVVNVGATAGVSLIFPTEFKHKIKYNYLRVFTGHYARKFSKA
jgi:hypothetical protein